MALDRYNHIVTLQAWELVIVDNGSTDNTAEVIEEFRSTTDVCVRPVLEPAMGLSRARNLGWQSARGDIVAFTDDDCYPQSDFVEEIWNVFKGEQVGYSGGRILLFDVADYPITIQLSQKRSPILPRSFVPAGFIQGANMAVRRSVLDALGGFDEMLGAGTRFPSEDVDFISRASAAGYTGVYDPGPVVFHHHRRRDPGTVAALRRSYDLGRGAYYMKCVLDVNRRRNALDWWFTVTARSLKRNKFRRNGLPRCAFEIWGAFLYCCVRISPRLRARKM